MHSCGLEQNVLYSSQVFFVCATVGFEWNFHQPFFEWFRYWWQHFVMQFLEWLSTKIEANPIFST